MTPGSVSRVVSATLLAAIAAGCVTWSTAVTAAATQQPNPNPQPLPSISGVTFERLVKPFETLDADGRPYALPFLGGLDVPRPQFVDIDNDGDLDLFVQEYSNQLWFFENVGTRSAPVYEWRSDSYQDVEIGEWYRFVDLDGDGQTDLLSERPISHIRHYRNTGSDGAPRLEFVSDLLDGLGEPVFLDRQNLPAIVDLDCDGRLDLFVGRVEGVVDRFEALEPNSARFGFVTDFFEGIEIIGQIGGRPTMRHGANALAFGDFEGDGDVDLFWGDFFEPSILLIENIGRTCSTPSFQVDPIVLPWAEGTSTSGYNAPAPVDLDGDGDLDFLMGVLGGAFNPTGTAEDNFYFWERTAVDAFELRTRRFLDGIDIGGDASPELGDIDGDGDLDLVVGNRTDATSADGARLVIFLNEGTATAPRFRRAETLKLAEAYNQAPALGDLDGDGDLDMLIGTWNQDVLFARNEGTPTSPKWVVDESMTITPERMSHAAPALGDIDGDGDLDLFLGQATGQIAFFRNTGSATTPVFEPVAEPLEGIRVSRRSALDLVDVDGDGRLDMVVGSENGDLVAFRNVGSGAEPRFEASPAFHMTQPSTSVPAFGDVTGDGVPDLFVGTTSGGLRFYAGSGL